MSDKLTLLLNEKEYVLSESLKEAVESRAESEFSENELFDCWWTTNERGDPILKIETRGCWVPWDRLERLEFEMEEVEKPTESDDDSDETEDIDNGNGVKSVPKDDVDMSSPDPATGEEEDGDEPDTKFMVTHPSSHYVPQPEQDDPEKLPPDPDELPEDPTLVAWIPDDEREEVWSTGKALVPTDLFLEWNVQIRADEAVEGETKVVPVTDSGGNLTETKEVPKTNNHDQWVEMAERHECEVIAEKQPSDEPEAPESQQPTGYAGKTPDDDEKKTGTAGGTNWSV